MGRRIEGRVTAVHAQGWAERYAYDDAGNQTAASWPSRHPGREAAGPRVCTGTTSPAPETSASSTTPSAGSPCGRRPASPP
ncbi:hypothetical protein [Streptomyces sp. NPDC088254]|uniref:hypothetical protein n=1 Tax=Streptomyces sp. NPDC088254 TaxID=3365847 RepID=UPI0037F170FE